MRTVGLISDTHGLLRPEAVAALRGCDVIVHAGDVGDPKILDELARLAPITAVRGNVDEGDWANLLPASAVVTVDDVSIFVIHDVAELRAEAARSGHRVVVSGHSHRPGWNEDGGVLFVNPGSAGPRRFKLPIFVGYLSIEGATVTPRLLTLTPQR